MKYLEKHSDILVLVILFVYNVVLIVYLISLVQSIKIDLFQKYF